MKGEEKFKNYFSCIIIHLLNDRFVLGFLGDSEGKESAYDAGDPILFPGLGRSLGEGNGYPFQYSCLKNSINGGV